MANRKVIAYNRKAAHDYFLEDRYEAGLVLTGTEIKSIRKGKVQLKDSYISFVNQEAFIKEMHIAPYDFGNRFNHDETRIRKLLLHREEIRKLQQKVKLKGYTIVPTSLYLEKGLAKLEIALAKGKELHDKRQSEKERDAKREIAKAMKRY
ncbi:SsrA-binding protein SmpB [Massilicoli timonensis]|uniref:SsrA-binding protein n=1 Tax=Massilicoli timonensis TaxID=2015901 RepID=A0ABT1SMM8_9FIRM|nr:SsrA-binding protein SmpB [Massilicoli timonensis]MCQ5121960.1 SsrA-binding protein SmpB [Massilicoli timonensis]HIR15828.1 SsrA-binding protein SmpB [Candidatus Onthosoma merdavium]